MHLLKPKHHKLKAEEAEALLKKLNISLWQLPKIKKGDPALPADTQIGDIIRIERKSNNKVVYYYRTVIPN